MRNLSLLLLLCLPACNSDTGASSAPAVDGRLIGVWEMEQVFEMGQDVTHRHDPSDDRWIAFDQDGVFTSGGGPGGINTGRWTFDRATNELYLDSDAGKDDDSYWIVDLMDDEMQWQGARFEFGKRFTIIHRRRRMNTQLVLASGIEEDGRVTPAWADAVRNRHTGEEMAELLSIRRDQTHDEAQWAGLIADRLVVWKGWMDSLAVPFGAVEPPGTVAVLLGNSGGEDAFTYADSTIGFDLSRLYDIYGDASLAENGDRIDRFFAHEMTHIYHKAWRRKHDPAIDTPLDAALWDCLVEGIGNYRSLSAKWVTPSGSLTPHAEGVLAELEPIFVERLRALRDADEREASRLMEGLSSGPFASKWGALTTALWLAQEAGGDDRGLCRWVDAGHVGVLVLARKYLPEGLAAELPVAIEPIAHP